MAGVGGPIIDEIGNKHGRWTILSFSHSNVGAFWNCVCDCGTHKKIKGTNLRNGGSKSCGCIRIETVLAKRTDDEREVAHSYSVYKSAAKHGAREYEWKIPRDLFDKVTKQPCHYCGKNDQRNGLDCIDSRFDYIPSNILSCCGPCNRAKYTMNYLDFIEYLDRLARFRITKDNSNV